MNKKKRHVLILLVCMLVFCMLCSVPVSASGVTGDSADTVGISLYDVSTALTDYVNRVLGPNTNEKHLTNKVTELPGSGNNNNVGNAGAFVGYGDNDRGFTGFIVNNITGSASTSTYSSWIGVETGDNNHIYGYVRYGYLLNSLGLDDTGNNTSLPRKLIGLAVYGLYLVCSMVTDVFSFVVRLLKILNPFVFLTTSANTAFDDAVKASLPSAGGVGAPNAVKSALTGVGDIYGEFYTMLNDYAYSLIIPIFLVVLLASILLMRSNIGGKIATFLKRFLFIVVGIPILGIMYTSTLDQISEMCENGRNVSATQMVASSFIDFETWASTGRLSPTDSGNITLTSVGKGTTAPTDAGGADATAINALRKTVWYLNKKMGIVDGVSASFSSDNFIGNGVWDENGEINEWTDSETSVRDQVLNMIQRYMNSNYYYAASWASTVSQTLNSKYKDDMGSSSSTEPANSNGNKIYQMASDTDEVDDWMNREESDNNAIFKGNEMSDHKWPAKKFNIFDNGRLNASGLIDGPNVNEVTLKFSGTWPSNAADPDSNGGLSTISLYNYLASSFDSASITTYSAEQLANEYVGDAHYSVNLVGTGALRILYALNCIVIMFVMAALAVFYAGGMLLSNIKRGFTLLTAIPGAMVGVLKSIVQAVTYVVLMIAELVGTFFMYELISRLLAVFATVVENFAKTEFTNLSILGGLFGQYGASVPAFEAASGSWVLYLNLVVSSTLVFMAFVFVAKRWAVILRAYVASWVWLFRMATMAEFRPMFDELVDRGFAIRKPTGVALLPEREVAV